MPKFSWAVEQGLEDIPEPLRKKRKQRPEDLLQKGCIKFLRLLGRSTQHAVRFIVAQPESMGKRTMWQLNHAKDMGILGNAGHPEIIVIDTRRGVRFILLELKAENGRMSEGQLDWEAWCNARGIEHHVVRAVDQLASIVG